MDRFTIVEAYYHFFRDTYNGQWDPKYARLSKMRTYYTPRGAAEYGPSTPEAQALYDSLVAEES